MLQGTQKVQMFEKILNLYYIARILELGGRGNSLEILPIRDTHPLQRKLTLGSFDLTRDWLLQPPPHPLLGVNETMSFKRDHLFIVYKHDAG